VLLVEQTHTALLRLTRELADRSVERLPTERDLAIRLGTSRTTVRKALDALERDGVIRRIRGRAGGAYLTRVSPAPASPEDMEPLCSSRRLLRSLNTVKGVPQMLHEQGFRDGTKVISAGIDRPSPRAAELLGIRPDTQGVSLLRLRFADGDTLSLERMYLRGPQCLGILGMHLDAVYEALRSAFGIRICVADESIALATVSAPVGALLGLLQGTPVLKVERVGYDQNGLPVEYSVDLFRADRTQLNVRTGTQISTAVSEAAATE
jgi:GntR family transcriptional regulator